MVENKINRSQELQSLLNTPREDLTILFGNFIDSPFDQELGGVAREGHVNKYNESKSVQMTFSKEQRPYVALSINCINKIANGNIYGGAGITPTLDQRIVNSYVSGIKINRNFRFVDALIESTSSLLDYFNEHHSNLMPALQGSFEVAGAEGIEIAIGLSNQTLNAAKVEELTPSNKNEYLKKILAPMLFVGFHRTYADDGIDPYEVHCTGRSLGIKIAEKSVEAALTLTGLKDELGIELNGENYNWHNEPISSYFRNKIRLLTTTISPELSSSS